VVAACPHLSSRGDDGREGLSFFKSLGFPKNKILMKVYTGDIPQPKTPTITIATTSQESGCFKTDQMLK
jgi:hypothetical protein